MLHAKGNKEQDRQFEVLFIPAEILNKAIVPSQCLFFSIKS
jgi:hypothetical protein